MAASKPKAVYATDQRQMNVLIMANRRGGTDYTVTWRHCLAGEETMREVVLLRGHWPNTLNEPWQGIRAFWAICGSLRLHALAKKPDA